MNKTDEKCSEDTHRKIAEVTTFRWCSFCAEPLDKYRKLGNWEPQHE